MSLPNDEKQPPRQSNPYCAFRNDQERRRALISRDVRIAFVAVVLSAAAIFGSDREILPVIGNLKHLSSGEIGRTISSTGSAARSAAGR